MDRETLIAWAEGFTGIALAIFCCVGVAHGFDHAMKPAVLACTAVIGVVALWINALTTNKSTGTNFANAAASISPKRAAMMSVGLLLFGLVIMALGVL